MNEIYWDDYPSSSVGLAIQNDTLVLLFEGKSSEYRKSFSGKITIGLHLEEQILVGSLYYRSEDGFQEEVRYKLIGAFEDDSWEFFSGSWEEQGESYKFDALLEPIEKGTVNIETIDEMDIVEDSNKPRSDNAQARNISERQGAMRQRAARSDARVRKIQRSMELYYGLPQGSVRLVNPDKTLIHPSAKIGTLRDRWITEEI
ncbi:hypothetical protein [Acinetobacter sp. ANC 4973]|uniref:hypothetical protein n=1 Tax=Acinetobacter sp. ANC 4973 TaxID=1977871 RepID=UPI000A3335A2|nr:hypothetical protein [Acinetobacter sp. ANC 4973]OTH01024.1 hypothetical protein B9T30_02905 [Acinetobacter sp. ANC 4973]